MRESYQRIFDVLAEASSLLPEHPSVKTRPSKASAHALMARCYLQIGVFDSAAIHADLALELMSELIDYNTVDIEASFPFPQYNEEVVFSDATAMTAALTRNSINVDSLLFDSYDLGDLRKEAYFYLNGSNRAYKGSYNGNSAHFIGIKTPELLLIRAEVAVRKGNTEQALEDLNHLLRNRYQQGSFIEVNITEPKKLLQKILLERRKELVYCGLRWADLKRLNREKETQTVLKRQLGEAMYELLPGDGRYNLPIPDDAVTLGELVQNER